MSIKKQSSEIKRLIKAFETEANKFHDITFSTFTISQTSYDNSIFKSPNHAILLWQYYGKINEKHTAKDFMSNFVGNTFWGIPGSELSAYGLIEGDACDLFVKMARRAAHIFNDKESEIIKSKVVYEIMEKEKDGVSKNIVSVNDHSLAIWLNYLLFFLSNNNHKNVGKQIIDIDPFSLSLLALEQLLTEPIIKKVDKSLTRIEDIEFDVALSFPGEKRSFVSNIAKILRKNLDSDKLFYDFDYQSQLAKPNLDTLLQKIYRNNSKLIVVFLSNEYTQKEWCGLEWRAIRDIIKTKEDDKIMFIKFDDSPVDGVFSTDGYIDARHCTEKQIAKYILERIKLNK